MVLSWVQKMLKVLRPHISLRQSFVKLSLKNKLAKEKKIAGGWFVYVDRIK